jgi:crotonyl-CoA carboxylase/reductase
MKDLYAVGEIPPEFHVPKTMHAWAIRRENSWWVSPGGCQA